jgi:hypothetical protein
MVALRLAVGDRPPATKPSVFVRSRRCAATGANGGPQSAWRGLAGSYRRSARRRTSPPIDPLSDFGYISPVDPPPVQADTVTGSTLKGACCVYSHGL